MQILTFLIDEEKFAVDIGLVDTIEKSMPITQVPGAKKYVTGLISNRGDVIPVINSGLILNKKEPKDAFENLIIVNVENDKFALAVNEIDDVMDIEPEDIKKVNGENSMPVVKVNSDIITVLTYGELKKI